MYIGYAIVYYSSDGNEQKLHIIIMHCYLLLNCNINIQNNATAHSDFIGNKYTYLLTYFIANFCNSLMTLSGS